MTKQLRRLLEENRKHFRLLEIEHSTDLSQGTLAKTLKGQQRKDISPEQEARVRAYFIRLKKCLDKYLSE